MPSPAALLSANASLSAMLGGTAGIGNGSVTPAAGVTQGTDFSSLLPVPADLVPSGTSRPSLPLSAAVTTDTDSDKDSLAASGGSQPPASSGKGLPLAALVSAVLPAPVTLSALVKTSSATGDATENASDDATGSTEQTPAPAIDINNSAALTLMAVVHGTAPQSASTSASTCANLIPATVLMSTSDSTSTAPSFPTLASADVQAAYARDAASSSLPRPGFTLLSDTTGDNDATAQTVAQTTARTIVQTTARTMAHTTPAQSPRTTASAAILPQPTITLAAATTATLAQPGFTLLADASPSSPTMPRPATSDATSATGPESVLPQQATLASAPTPALRVALALPIAPTLPAASAATTLPSDAVPASVSAPTAPLRLASARGSTPQGKVATIPTRTASTRADSPVGPAIDLDAEEAQAGFSAHSPTSPSADGASVLDNAPSLTQPLASAGTAVAAQTLAATGGAATSTLATQQGGTDMAALVDRLVEARAAARSGLSSPVVQASLTHADFGRVSLRFNTDDDGLSVSMASSDPGFAPAAQAALAQAPAVSANAQSHGAGQQGSNQQGSGQPGLHWTQSSAQPALQANTGGQSSMGGSSGQGGQGWAQGGQTSAPTGQNTPAAQARSASSSTSTTASPRNRGGILA